MNSLQIKKDLVVKKTVALLIKRGKKAKAVNLLCKAFKTTQTLVGGPRSLEVFLQNVYRLQPYVKLTFVKKSGIKHAIPTLLQPSNSQARACRLLIVSALKRNEYAFNDKLANELAEAYLLQGISVKKYTENIRSVLASRPNLDMFR